MRYCVEYYDDVAGNGTRCFPTEWERDDFIMVMQLDNFYLFEEEK